MSRALPVALILAAFTLSPAADPPPERAAAVAANKALGRGVNFGNALEAPKEGDWGMKLEADYFKHIRAAGFNHVRVPVKWSAHADAKPPYTIDPAFFARIDWVLDQAAANGLGV